MIFFLILIILCVIAVLLLFGVDFCFYLWKRYSRFHIGRWPDCQEWKNAVIQCAIRWTKKTPVVKASDNCRYILLDMLQGKYKSNKIQSWQLGSLILGLSHIGTAECRSAVDKSIERLLDNSGMFRKKPTNVDCGLLSYALLKQLSPDHVKPAMDYAAELIRSNITVDGMIAYTGKESDERFVDTLGLTCPFLALYAKVYNQPEFAKLAIEQLQQFSQYGLQPGSFLPNHAFSSETKLPLGVYGWGRGTAWYVLGLIDTYPELINDVDRTWLREQIQQVADAYLPYQRADGGFGYILQMKQGYDSSATAALGYFYRQASVILKRDDYANVADKCLGKLRTVTKITGAIDWCQGDTKGIGTFAQTYDVMPFAQGMTLRAFNENGDVYG